PRSPVSALRGADAVYNAEAARALLSGKPGPVRDAVVLNAAAAFAAFEGLSADISRDLDAALRRGLDRAADAIDSGSAAETLQRWLAVAKSCRDGD
ncbi:MAG: anthranilate phosphoribosyltransferase, partial [Stackebrandtia sp.]